MELINKKTIFVFLLVIFALRFFDAVIMSNGMFKNLAYAYITLAIFLSVPYFFTYKGGFILPVQLICGAIVLSIFMAGYSWGQGLSYAPTTIPYMIWFVFFYLLYANVSIQAIEKIVLFYGMVYMLLFLFQFTHTNVVYFGFHEEFKEDRGVIRVAFPGAGVFFLSCYMAVNKVTSSVGRQKYLWLLYALAGIVINVMQVTRQAIVIMLFMYLIHFLRNVKLVHKIATIIVFVISGYLFINSDSNISKGLAEQQKTDASAGKDYIRFISADYYLTQFSPTALSRVFGNGFYNVNSNYGRRITTLEDNYGYFLSDVGLVEVYVLLGILAVVGYLLIFLKSFTISLPAEFQYLRYYLWMIMLTCLTSDSLISTGFLITTVFVLYIYQRFYEKEKFDKFHMALAGGHNA